MDSGCRRTVSGKKCHAEARRRLAELGLRPVEAPCEDRFRFGDGRVIRASRSWRYPLGIYGRNGILNVAEAPQERPPLLSAKCMDELGVVMDFKEKAVTVASDTRPTQMLSSGYPA